MSCGNLQLRVGREQPSVLHPEPDLHPDLEVGDITVDHLPANLLRFKPFDIAYGLGGLADSGTNSLVDAVGTAAHDLGQPVHVITHDPTQPHPPGDPGGTVGGRKVW